MLVMAIVFSGGVVPSSLQHFAIEDDSISLVADDTEEDTNMVGGPLWRLAIRVTTFGKFRLIERTFSAWQRHQQQRCSSRNQTLIALAHAKQWRCHLVFSSWLKYIQIQRKKRIDEVRRITYEIEKKI